MNPSTQEGLLAPSDIADLTGVSRAAVSNWRKRNNDFPRPVNDNPGKPLFSASDINDWLAQHPEKLKSGADVRSSIKPWEAALRGAANRLRGRIEPHEQWALFVETALDVAQGTVSLPSHQSDDQQVEELRRVFSKIPAEDLSDAVDGLLERTSRALGKAVGWNGFVGSRTSALLASFASRMDGGTLYDPACGIGVALLQALNMGARPSRIVGHDINHEALEIAHGRAALRDIDIHLHAADVLHADPDPELKADVVLAEPPFGLRIPHENPLVDPRLKFGIPPRSSSEAFWLQHVVAHLADGGIGYILTSPMLLSRSGQDAAIRRNLLLAGWVRAVVSLPGKMLPHTSIAPALWVVQPPEGSVRHKVLVVDASNVDSPENSVAAWLADDEVPTDVPSARVAVDELASGKCDLTPARWVSPNEVDAAQIATAFSSARKQLSETSLKFEQTVQRIEPPRISGDAPVFTIDELVNSGALRLSVARPVRDVDAELEERIVDARSIRTRELPKITEPPSADAAGHLTQPGDVLLTNTGEVHAVVDETGGHLLSGSIYRIRITDYSKFDPHYLADVLEGDWNLRLATGAAMQRVPYREIEVPVPALHEQQAIRDTLSMAREAARHAALASELAAQLSTTTLNAIRYAAPLT